MGKRHAFFAKVPSTCLTPPVPGLSQAMVLYRELSSKVNCPHYNLEALLTVNNPRRKARSCGHKKNRFTSLRIAREAKRSTLIFDST